MNKIFYLSTSGCGTPDYLIIAPDVDAAFKLAEQEWSKEYGHIRDCYHIGSSWNWNTGKVTAGNSVADVKDTGFTTDNPIGIVNLKNL